MWHGRTAKERPSRSASSATLELNPEVEPGFLWTMRLSRLSKGAFMTDAESITRALGGTWHGRYGLSLCPAHANTNTPALSLSDGREGRLLAKCHAGCTFEEVSAALHLLKGVEFSSAVFQPAPAAEAARLAAERKSVARRADQARRVWEEAGPVAGTLAEAYLRGRGISCALPGTLRFNPSCWHLSARRFPALLALVEGADAMAVHRTYLAPDCGGKANVDPAKSMLGACRGGAVRLRAGTGPLLVCEGIETGLSLASGLLDGGEEVWAALSTSGMAGLRLPAKPAELTIASDGDAPGRKAAQALAHRAHALGWAASLLAAPEGIDWNDVLLERRAA
jgi:hypothetical protein